MMTTDQVARLSIDYFHASVAAAARHRDGDTAGVLVDGVPAIPAAVAVASDGRLQVGRDAAEIGAHDLNRYVRLPGQHLIDNAVTVGTVEIKPVDMVAATLRHVVNTSVQANGGKFEDVVLCVPTAWGPQRRTAMREAAHRAGLGQVTLRDASDAIARSAAADGAVTPTGAMVAVCRLDATLGEVSLLRRQAEGFEQVAAIDVGELGSVSGDTIVEQAVRALLDALDSTHLRGDQLAAVYCQVPAGMMPGLAAALTTGAGLAVGPVLVAEQAAALGGLYAAVPAAKVANPWPWSRAAYSVASFAVAAGTALVVATQLLGSTEVYAQTSISARRVVTDWAAWGLVAVFATLSVLSVALLMADIRTARSAARQRAAARGQRDTVLGSALPIVAALGVGAAVIWALAGAATFEAPPGPFLKATLLAAVPLAVLLALLGLLVARTPGAVAWRDRLRFPLGALAVAAAGVVAVQVPYTGIPAGLSSWWPVLEVAGASGMGVTVALLLTPRPVWRTVLAVVLSIVAALLISLDTLTAIGVVLIVSIIWWWLVRLVQAGLAFISGLRMLNPRLGDDDQTAHPQP